MTKCLIFPSQIYTKKKLYWITFQLTARCWKSCYKLYQILSRSELSTESNRYQIASYCWWFLERIMSLYICWNWYCFSSSNSDATQRKLEWKNWTFSLWLKRKGLKQFYRSNGTRIFNASCKAMKIECLMNFQLASSYSVLQISRI